MPVKVNWCTDMFVFGLCPSSNF